MNSGTYILIMIMWITIFIALRNKRKDAIIRQLIEKRKTGGNTEMKELAEKFIEKECLIYSFDNSKQYKGIIKEVKDGAILIENDGKLEVINLDFVIRIREYPKKKNGKKKSVILD